MSYKANIYESARMAECHQPVSESTVDCSHTWHHCLWPYKTSSSLAIKDSSLAETCTWNTPPLAILRGARNNMKWNKVNLKVASSKPGKGEQGKSTTIAWGRPSIMKQITKSLYSIELSNHLKSNLKSNHKANHKSTCHDARAATHDLVSMGASTVSEFLSHHWLWIVHGISNVTASHKVVILTMNFSALVLFPALAQCFSMLHTILVFFLWYQVYR